MDKNLTVAAYVIQFFADKLSTTNPTFFANELHGYVRQSSGKLPAPGTVDRILRKLRNEGKINYTVVNRSTSYYKAEPVTVQVNG